MTPTSGSRGGGRAAFQAPRPQTMQQRQQTRMPQNPQPGSRGQPAPSSGRGGRRERGPGRGNVVQSIRLPPLKGDDYALIWDYIQVPEHFNAIHGAGRKTTPGVKYPSRETAFGHLAGALVYSGFPSMDAENLSKRFDRYVAMYRKALDWKNSSGEGLNDDEIFCGYTIDEKLERVCPHFHRMHEIYVERANVAPPFLAEIGRGQAKTSQAEEHSEALEDDDQEYTERDTEYAEDNPTEIMAAYDIIGGDVSQQTPNARREAEPNTQTGTQETRPGIRDRNTTMPHAHRTQSHHNPMESPAEGTAQSRGASNSAAANRDKAAKNKQKATLDKEKPMSKINLAAVYADKCKDKSEYRCQLIESKAKWKTEELQDRREARLEATNLQQRLDKFNRIHQLKMQEKVSEREEKRQRLDQEHQMAISKQQMKTTILMELFKSQRSKEEIVELMEFIDSAGI